MFIKKIFQKLYGCCIMGFVCGVLLSFFLPPVIIAIIEGVLLAIICWCVYFV